MGERRGAGTEKRRRDRREREREREKEREREAMGGCCEGKDRCEPKKMEEKEKTTTTTSCCGPTPAPATKQGGGCCGGTAQTQSKTKTKDDVVEGVKEYYGETLKSSSDLKTSACTSCEKPNDTIVEIMKLIPEQVLSKFYGCGYPTPLGIEGKRVLDLGCGSGRDCYIASALVGESGSVIGVDMTEQQLQVAKDHAEEYTKHKLNYSKSNMRFLHGYIEKLTDLGIEAGSVDLIISNCVVNLSVDKKRVLQQLYTVMAQGGEFQFSDVFSDVVLPDNVRTDKVLVGECLGGAMEINQFVELAEKTGFAPPLMVSKKGIDIHDPDIRKLVGEHTNFYSITYRLFKK